MKKIIYLKYKLVPVCQVDVAPSIKEPTLSHVPPMN